MDPVHTAAAPVEVELKLAIVNRDAGEVRLLLARLPVLARRKPQVQHLETIYFDTPDHQLAARRVSLRVRRIGGRGRARWVQTLKTSGAEQSALSVRGEWEAPVVGAHPELSALADTPWAAMDADGALFASLVPCFHTRFTRTLWLLRRRDRSEIEIALDHGVIAAGQRAMPLCEIELELRRGTPDLLFDLASLIAAALPVLPLEQSKAARGFALLHDTVEAPVTAQPVALDEHLPAASVIQAMLLERFGQFLANLTRLQTSDEPELVHQARVGWRRFSSSVRFFAPLLALDLVALRSSLEPLLNALRGTRDVDAVIHDCLPRLHQVFLGNQPGRAPDWQAMMSDLQGLATARRVDVREASADARVGAALLAMNARLFEISGQGHTGKPAQQLAQKLAQKLAQAEFSLADYARARILRMFDTLRVRIRQVDDAETEHRVRMRARRLRYEIESFATVLPRHLARSKLKALARLQADIGAERDLAQAVTILIQWPQHRAIAEFLRGVIAGRARATKAAGKSAT